MEEIERILAPAAGGCLIITIGNELRGDDGVGPYIWEQLAGLQGDFCLLNGGQRPENIIDEAIEAAAGRIVIIDAADFGGLPGERRIIEEHLINDFTLSTHTFPLPVLSAIIKEDSGSDIYFLGIQSASMQLGEGLSPAVKDSADELVEQIKTAFDS